MSINKQINNSKKLKIFLCHSGGDRPEISELYKRLTQDGFKVWMREEDLLPGQNWKLEIEKEVRAADVVLLCISKEASSQGLSQRELNLALDIAEEKPTEGVFIIPVRLEECEIPIRVKDWTYEDYFLNPERTYQRLLRVFMLHIKEKTEPEEKESQITDAANNISRSTRIFISYKRKAKPDEQLALQLYNTLGEQYQVFIDQAMSAGTDWVWRIDEELHQADFLIALLSEDSIGSEMVTQEIARARELAEQNNGKPRILPIRVAYDQAFGHPLDFYLSRINWAFWNNPDDTEELLEDLRRAIAGEDLSIKPENPITERTYRNPNEVIPLPMPVAQPVLEKPEGTMSPESKFYINRESDEIALQTIKGQSLGSGETLVIKGPRQMGKSSLLLQVIKEAKIIEKQVIFLDFQLFDKSALEDPEVFYRQFCVWLSNRLKLPDKTEDYWTPSLSRSLRCSNYFELYILEEIAQPLVLAMDEVDRLFETKFQSDFFGMLRAWHNDRYRSPWKRLDLVLVTSTEPYHLINTPNQSPFNVGEVLRLTDFEPMHITELNQRHGNVLKSNEEKHLYDLLEGHPYLTRRAFYLLASKRVNFMELVDQAASERGPFGDHLRNHLFRLQGRNDLIEGLRQVLRTKSRPDELVFWQLQGAGLVKETEQHLVIPRCSLYAEFFKEHLNG